MGSDVDRENIKLDAYSAIAVVCALVFGFSVTILHSDLQNYDEAAAEGDTPPDTASHVAIVLGAVATGASMLATLVFSMELYHGKKLLHKYGAGSARAFSSDAGNKRKKAIARLCMALSLGCLPCQVIARCYASQELPGGIAYGVTVVLSAFLLATLFLQSMTVSLIEKIVKSNEE